MTRNIKLVIEYEGTNYLGWQRQPHGLTIQEVIETSLERITEENIKVIGSGRTDSGVHALGQVANFKTRSRLSTEDFQKGLNSMLPKDIAIIQAGEADAEFHAQFSAKSKVYVYRILNRDFPSALLRKRAWFIPYPLDTKLMNEAVLMLKGEHDFRAFALTGAEVKSTVRTVQDAAIEMQNGLLEFRIEANGFLKRMVRLIVGTLVQVGKQKITPVQFRDILAAGEKMRYVYSAPPCGLYLKEVKY
ncbi:MAG: tRNA pseudouridine(38-40) synthase TruA [Deltaproteobacteria bacterium]